MAGGRNREFLSDPRAFFRRHILEIKDKTPSIKGLYDCDFVDTEKRGEKIFIVVDDYDSRSHGCGATPIPAYCLPAVYNASSSLRLGQDARFLFTSALTGCIFAAYGADARNVTVEHVNEKNGMAAVSIAARCEEILNMHYPFCKIVLRSEDAAAGANGQDVYVYEDSAAVMGIRDEATGEWQFYFREDLFVPQDRLL